jgi:hypothetical protein
MPVGTALMWVGGGVFAIGLILRFAPGLLSWFGNLPGDIRIERDGSRTFIPITSMIVVSVALTVVINLVIRLLQDR